MLLCPAYTFMDFRTDKLEQSKLHPQALQSGIWKHNCKI